MAKSDFGPASDRLCRLFTDPGSRYLVLQGLITIILSYELLFDVESVISRSMSNGLVMGIMAGELRYRDGTVVRILFPAVPAPAAREETMPKAMLAKEMKRFCLWRKTRSNEAGTVDLTAASLSSLGGGLISRGAYAHTPILMELFISP